MSRVLNFFFALGQLVAFALAGVDLPFCQETPNLAYMYDCSYSQSFQVTGYCILGNMLYVLGPNYYPTCYYSFMNNDNIIAVNGYRIITIDDLSKVTIKMDDESNEYSLQNIAMVSCSYIQNSPFCAQTTGIIRDKTSTYFNIFLNSTIANAKADTHRSYCYTSTIGQLVKIDNEISLCLGDKVYVPLSPFNTGYYMMYGTNSKDSVFSTPAKSNALIKFGKDYFIFDITSPIIDNYLDYNKHFLSTTFYIGTFYNTLYTCTYGICEHSTVKVENNKFLYPTDNRDYFSGIIYEFKNNEREKTVTIFKSKFSGISAFITQDHTVYKELSNEDYANSQLLNDYNLSNTYIFYCQYGECLPTRGFIKYRTNNGSFQINYCDSNCYSPVTYTSCTTAPAAYYDTKTSNFYICVKSSTKNNSYEKKLISDDDINYYAEPVLFGSNYYNIYESDEGGNIVGYSKANGALYVDGDDDGTKDLISCSCLYKENPSSCQFLRNYSGYLMDMLADESNHLISCNHSVCENVVKNNGYFTSDDGTVIKCLESECSVESNIEVSCNGHSGEVILKNFEPKYCNGNKAMDFTDKSSHYILNNIAAASTYPNLENGNDTIIIQADRYSITQISTTEEGLCIDTGTNTVVSDPECTNTGLTKYYCDTICTTCTLEKQLNAKYKNNNSKISSCAVYLKTHSGALSIYANSKSVFMIVGMISLLLLLL